MARLEDQNTLGASGSVNLIKLLYDYGATDQALESQKFRLEAARHEINGQAELQNLQLIKIG